MKPVHSYFICATPRSGSTLLCEALRNTNIAGVPDEYFGPMHVERWNKVWHAKDERDYLQHVFARGTTSNGVFGGKIMGLYWDHFITHLRRGTGMDKADPRELIDAVFPHVRYIWITRRDRVRQAVSWLKFIQGVAWFWEKEEPQVVEKLEFKAEIIEEFIVQTALADSAWQEYFHGAGVDPYVVVYEDFVGSYEETTRALLAYLGIACPKDLGGEKRRLKKQADDLSEEWVAKYLALKAQEAGR